MMEEKDFSDKTGQEDSWQTLQEYGENLRRQKRLAETIDRLAAARPSARRKPYVMYMASGAVAACLLLLLLVRPLTERNVSQPHPDELAQVAPADSAVREAVALQADNRLINNDEEVGQPDVQRQPRPRVRSNRSNQPAVLPVQLEEEPLLRQNVAEPRPLPVESASVPEWMEMDAERDDVYELDELPASLEPVKRRPVVKANVAADSTQVATPVTTPVTGNAVVISQNLLISYAPDANSHKFHLFPKMESSRHRKLPLFAYKIDI